MPDHVQDGSRARRVVRVIRRVMLGIVARLPLIRPLFVIEVGVFGCGSSGKSAVMPNFRKLERQRIMRRGKDVRDGQHAEGHRQHDDQPDACRERPSQHDEHLVARIPTAGKAECASKVISSLVAVDGELLTIFDISWLPALPLPAAALSSIRCYRRLPIRPRQGRIGHCPQETAHVSSPCL